MFFWQFVSLWNFDIAAFDLNSIRESLGLNIRRYPIKS